MLAHRLKHRTNIKATLDRNVTSVLLFVLIFYSKESDIVTQFLASKGGGRWSFCQEEIIYFNPARQHADNF